MLTIKPEHATAALKFKLAWIKSACRYVTQYIMLSNGYHQLLIKQSSLKIVSVNRIIVQKALNDQSLVDPVRPLAVSTMHAASAGSLLPTQLA